MLRAHDQRTAGIECGADQFVARPFADRQRLAGQHRFIDRAAAFHHHAVYRHFLTGPHAQGVTDMHMAERHVFLALVGVDAARGLGCQSEQRLDGGRGRGACPEFEDLTEQG